MKNNPLPPNNTRIGFNYFPDTLHYRETDLQGWLPELKALGASWLVLDAPSDRAIPEFFIQGLLANGIEPVLHFRMRVDVPPTMTEMRLLFQTYARWGVHYVVLFDRPNTRAWWSPATWVQSNLVERFLDYFLPLAEAALHAGLVPVFPPLEPGGDYWDTAFLRAALQGINRRGMTRLFKNLVLGAYAWPSGNSLNWGAGGPEKWPGARPYFTPPDSEDQRGFRIYEWYLAIARAVLPIPIQVLIVGGGAQIAEPDSKGGRISESEHAEFNLAIASLMANLNLGSSQDQALNPVPPEVLACNFWLLTAAANSKEAAKAWIKPGGDSLPVTGALRQWFEPQKPSFSPSVAPFDSVPTFPKGGYPTTSSTRDKAINHYLLLPLYEWGVSDWHLEVIQPFVKKHHPTIGFSLEEAKNAARVTVVGGSTSFPDSCLDELAVAGCSIQQIAGDGIRIATQLEAL
jgi:hypothetical protein